MDVVILEPVVVGIHWVAAIEYSHTPAVLDSTTDQLTVHVSELRYQGKDYLSIGGYVSWSRCTF